MAITAWSAKVVTSSICFGVNGCTLALVSASTPTTLPSRSQRDAKHRAVAGDPLRFVPSVLGIGHGIRDVNHSAFLRSASDKCPSARAYRMLLDEGLVGLSRKPMIGSCMVQSVLLTKKNHRVFRLA